ncbi:MAG: hypothetical protein QM785_14715 [Pyrinomonadaceae bacterium]
MTGMIGCIGLVGIFVFIVLLGLWSRKSRQGVAKIYEKYSLQPATDGPENVRQLIGSPKLFCRRGSIKLAFDNEVSFYWWEWFISSTTTTGTTRSTTIECFLAISFAPKSVGEDFKNAAFSEYEKGKAFSLKKAVGYETSLPYRVETLDDGTFVIFWRVLQRPHIMEHKIAWLKKNLSVGKSAATGTGNFIVVQAEVDLALMMMKHDGDYIASEVQSYSYFILAPRVFGEHLFENTLSEIGEIYLEHQAVMREREPNDPNYITVVGARPKVLSAVECADQPWLTAKVPVWEESVCIALSGDGRFKLSPTFFTGAIGAAK